MYIYVYVYVIKSSVISAQLASGVNILLVFAVLRACDCCICRCKVSSANEVVDRSLSDRVFSRVSNYNTLSARSRLMR